MKMHEIHQSTEQDINAIEAHLEKLLSRVTIAWDEALINLAKLDGTDLMDKAVREANYKTINQASALQAMKEAVRDIAVSIKSSKSNIAVQWKEWESSPA